ncbi:hypothetical protein [Methylocapsa sp. S129]|nr:hypothetical protein [Methylocapsa sp. S129]
MKVARCADDAGKPMLDAIAAPCGLSAGNGEAIGRIDRKYGKL